MGGRRQARIQGLLERLELRAQVTELEEKIELEKDPKKKTKLEEKLHAIDPTE